MNDGTYIDIFIFLHSDHLRGPGWSRPTSTPHYDEDIDMYRHVIQEREGFCYNSIGCVKVATAAWIACVRKLTMDYAHAPEDEET
jgi:hypothetical protein